MSRHGCKDIPRFITGFTAMALALYFIHENSAEMVILTASSFLFLICATDTLYSKIPNAFNALLAVAGLLYHFKSGGFPGAGWALLGLLTGLGLFLIPFLLGGMGAGDVKALAALGALLGPKIIFQVFLYTAIIGGGMGLLHYLFARSLWKKYLNLFNAFRAGTISTYLRNFPKGSQTERLRFPYAAAIALGFFAYVRWGELLKFFST
jgi:prepilin peptidase CpaA